MVTFEYTLKEIKPETTINVFDVNGHLIFRIPLSQKHGFVEWPTKNIQAGLYIYNVGYGKHVLGSGKVSIVK